MAALILWMGIGSVSFTRRTEASTRNVFVLMQRPQIYNARAALSSARPSRSRWRPLMFPPREDILRLLPEIILSRFGHPADADRAVSHARAPERARQPGRARERSGARLHDLSGDASRHGIFRLAAH